MMMRLTIALCLMLLLMPAAATAESYILKRVIVSWGDGTVDDSASSDTFSALGSMSVVGKIITQNIIFCTNATCINMVKNGSATILYVHPHIAYITLRQHDASVIDLIIQSVSPNIVTLYAFEDGVVEVHEWKPTTKNNKQLNSGGETHGSIARGIADALRAIRK